MCFSVTDPAGKPESPFFTEEMTPKLKWNSRSQAKVAEVYAYSGYLQQPTTNFV
jgi:hypothetical protein